MKTLATLLSLLMVTTANAATPSMDSLILIPGSAPGSPSNGQLWMTSAGLFGRVAGSTVGPYGTGGGSSGLTIGSTTITGGSTNRIEYNNGGVLGEYPITGSGNVVLSTSPSLVTPALGTPASGLMTNVTGLPLTTGVTGVLPAANGGTGVNNGSNTFTTSLPLIITGSGTQTFFFGNSGVPWTYNFPQFSVNLAYKTSSAWVSGQCLQAADTAGGISVTGAVCGSGGSGITQLTGDVTAGPGSGSQATTLATVNSNVGSFTNANITVNAKGLITAAANGSGGATFANPTATAGPTAINGSATTAMRSDAAPAIQLGTSSVPGLVQVDNRTIVAASGVISGSVLNRKVTVSPTVLSSDMGGQIVSNVTGGGTLTIPAIGSGVFPLNSSLSVVNYSASTEAVTTTPTVNTGGGCVTGTGIPAGDTWQIYPDADGTTLDCFQTVSASAGSSGLTVGSTTISGGTNGNIEFNNSGVLGEIATTGTGNVVRATSPTLVTPALGTPASGVATNLTGTASGLTAGTATAANGLNSATTTVVVNGATAPTNGQVLTATSGTAASWATPATGSGTVNSGTSGDLAYYATTGTAVSQLALSNNLAISSATLGITVPDNTKSTGYTIAAGDMGGQLNFNGANLTATIPSISSTVLANGMTVAIYNYNATSLTVSSAAAINGYPTTGSGPYVAILPPYNANSGASGLVITSNGTTLDAIATGTTAATVLGTGTSVSLVGPRQYFVCTSGPCTVTPPAPAAGYEFCVMNDDNVSAVITLAALTSSSGRYENTARTAYGTAGTGTLVSGGAVKDSVCIVGRDSTHYLTTTANGTWTAN